MATAWLDRLAAPAPSSRRGSSNARRNPGTPSRPSLDKRTTSLSGLSRVESLSSVNAGSTDRGQPTLGLRQELPRLTEAIDPLDILGDILGRSIAPETTNLARGVLTSRPRSLEDDIDFKSLSLNEYLETEGVRPPKDVSVRSIEVIEGYEGDRNGFEDLHKTIARCDQVLQTVESSLANFQKDLGTVSAEIETLQDRSVALTTRLNNRKKVEKLLGPAAEDVSISPFIVKTLSEGPMNDDWIRALAEFERRGQAIDAKLQEDTPIKAAQDVKPILDDLRNKANERIRDHIVAQIKAMRSPNINAQIIQQKNLVRYKDTFTFIMKHQDKLSGDIVQAYVNTMRWYYSDHFSRYRLALEKLKVVPIGKEDTIGADPSSSRGARPGASSALFDLGRRGEILSGNHHTALSSYVTSEDKSTHHLETPFCNYLLALMDNVTAEYQFMTTFFSALSYNQVNRRCGEIFSTTFVACREMTQTLLETSTLDCLGILLCIRATQKTAFELQRRRVPVLDDTINGLLILLWPAFQRAMDSHIESIKSLSSSLSAKSAASKLAFGVGGGASADALAKASMAPHFLTQRFGQFLYGILTISKESGDDEPVSSSLARLRSEFEIFLGKAARSVGGADKGKRDRFVDNQLVLIKTIVSDTGGRLAEDVQTWLNEAATRIRTGVTQAKR